MNIWNHKEVTMAELNAMSANTMAEHLNMEFVEMGSNYLVAKMPVNNHTHQPYGLLHGGASAALAETVGSVGSHLIIDQNKQLCVGMEINCNHIRGKRTGYVLAKATPIHLGATSHVWDIRITDEEGKLICISRLTMAILKLKQ